MCVHERVFGHGIAHPWACVLALARTCVQVEEEWQRQVADLEREEDRLGRDSPLPALVAVQLKLRTLEVEQRIISATGAWVVWCGWLRGARAGYGP